MSKYRKNYYRKEPSVDDEILGIISIFIFLILFQYWQYVLAIFGILILFKLIIWVHDKDLFSQFKNSKLYYHGESGKKYLDKLEQEKYESDRTQYNINCLKKGQYGESKILYTLLHMQNVPMYIIYDIRLQYRDFKAQIDFIVVTKRMIYIIEAKDLNGNLDIEGDGTFTRIFGRKKSGMKNPLTQNNDHEKVVKAILKNEKIKTVVTSLVVLTNDDSHIHFKHGANEYKNKIFRNDKLEENLIKMEQKKHIVRQEERIQYICDTLLKYRIEDIKTADIQKEDADAIIVKLKAYRKKMSEVENVPAYMIFNDNTILDLIQKKPASMEELTNIVGLGEYKVNKYGQNILNIMNNQKNKNKN